MDWTRRFVYARGQTFPVAALETVSAGAIKAAEEGFVENKTFGAYVQEQLAWRDRITILADRLHDLSIERTTA